MNITYFLEQKLKLIEYFFSVATAPFGETLRKIEQNVEPYVVRSNPEYAAGPAFQEEWDLADAAFQLAGASSLDYLQSTLHSFMFMYMEATGNLDVAKNIKLFKKGSWYANYQECFKQCFNIDWAASEANLELIEHLILTRNDFAHGSHLLTLYAFQDQKHAEKHPGAAFVDARWRNSKLMGTKLAVSRESLFEAIEQVRKLCGYLEAQRTPHLGQFKLSNRIAAKTLQKLAQRIQKKPQQDQNLTKSSDVE